MPNLTLLSIEPETRIEIPVPVGGGDGSSCVARLTLGNTSSYPVAFKVKSTAPKSYGIKPSSGSIKAGQTTEVQISRKAPEDGAPIKEAKKPDRFLVQAAVVDTEEKKLLIHAANRGKSAGLAKFWDNVPKESLEEQQLEAVIVESAELPDGNGQGDGSNGYHARKGEGRSGRDGGKGGAKAGRDQTNSQGVPSNEDVDAMVAKISKPGRAPVVAATAKGGGGEAANSGAMSVVEDNTTHAMKEGPSAQKVAVSTQECSRSSLAGQLKKPIKRMKEDVVINKHSRPVTFVLVDPNGTTLFTCAKDKLVLSWTIPEGEHLKTYEAHRGAVWACSISPDGLLLLTCGADNMVLLWEVATAQVLTEVQMPGVARCVEWALNVCPHGPLSGRRRFLACSNSFSKKPAALALFDIGPMRGTQFEEAQKLVNIEEPSLPSAAVQVAWAGTICEHICSVHSSGEVLFWNSMSGAMVGRLEAHANNLSQVAFPKERSLMATCGRADMEVRLWDLRYGVDEGSVRLVQRFKGDKPLNAVALRPSLTARDVAAATESGVRSAYCDCLAGGGQDARDVALVGAGGDADFEPVMLRVGGAQELEEYCEDEDESKGRKSSGGHFGPIHTLALWPGSSPQCISGSEDGNVRIREINQTSAAATATATAACTAPGATATTTAATSPATATTVSVASEMTASHSPAAQAPQLPPLPPQADSSQRVVAMYDFDPAAHGWPAASEHKPLPLRKGQEVQVIQDVSGGWALGRLSGMGTEGFFPLNYVMSLAKYHEIMQPYLPIEKTEPPLGQSALGRSPFGQSAVGQSTLGLGLGSGLGQTSQGLGLGLGLTQTSLGDVPDDDEDGDCAQS